MWEFLQCDAEAAGDHPPIKQPQVEPSVPECLLLLDQARFSRLFISEPVTDVLTMHVSTL